MTVSGIALSTSPSCCVFILRGSCVGASFPLLVFLSCILGGVFRRTSSTVFTFPCKFFRLLVFWRRRLFLRLFCSVLRFICNRIFLLSISCRSFVLLLFATSTFFRIAICFVVLGTAGVSARVASFLACTLSIGSFCVVLVTSTFFLLGILW